MNESNPPQTEAATAASKPSEFWTVFLLGLFLGVFGAHRFYARKFKTAIIQLITFGGLGIWSFVDTIIILLGKFKNDTGVVFQNPKPKVTWSIFAVVMVIAFISGANDKGGGDSGSGGSHSKYSLQGSSHKTARQLIRERAELLYGRRVDITIDSGYYGGAYQVTISDNQNFHNYTIVATVDEASQTITSWETKQID